MEEQILHFTEQFKWVPELLYPEHMPTHSSHTIVCGMGGSHLGARLLQRYNPTLDLSIHSDYGLPRKSLVRLRTALIVASSYSGETEETLDAAQRAVEAGLAVAVITTGGTLANFAHQHSLPLIVIPKDGVEPRMAVGASMLALARLMRNKELEEKIRNIGMQIDVRKGQAEGESLAKSLVGSIPLLYASTLDMPIAYFWKIVFNETGKVPAFYNLFPEMCHNELSGFDTTELARPLSANLHIIILDDSDNHPRVTARMRIMRKLLEERGITVTVVELVGADGLEKSLQGILTGIWTALFLARAYNAPDAATPLIAEFKRTMLTS